jgi:hypothetical protein
MKFQNFIPRTNMPAIREGSRLQSPREKSSLSQQWKAANEASKRAGDLTNSASQNSFAQQQRRMPIQVGSGIHPFAIYQLALIYRTSTPTDPDPDPLDPTAPVLWRTFRVRYGNIYTDSADGYTIVGTDNIDQPYADVWASKLDGTIVTPTDYVISANIAKEWFWLELDSGTTTATVKHNADPTADGWDSYPSIADNIIILGWVDTQTFNPGRSIIRQIQKTDITAGNGGGSVLPVWL